MELEIISMTPQERMYSYSQSSQIEAQTGCIGHLRGDFGAGQEFFSSWFDHRGEYKTDEFKAEFDEVVNSLRKKDGLLFSRDSMTRYCRQRPEAEMVGNYCTEYGFKHIIWSNYDLDYEDWRGDLEAEYPELSEDERISLMYEINGHYLDDERMNLNVQLSQPILVIGDLGLWNGRRMGYKEIPSGNIRDCLYGDTDYSTWYVDRLGDLRCDAIHHDGTNHYLYRVYKDGVRDSQIELLKEKLYRGTATRADITRVTRRLGDDIAKVYGFSIPRQRQAATIER